MFLIIKNIGSLVVQVIAGSVDNIRRLEVGIKYVLFSVISVVYMLFTVNAQAVTITGDGIQIFPPPPASLLPGMAENEKLQIFFEGTKSTAGSDVDVVVSGLLPGPYVIDTPASRVKGVLTGKFNSWYIHFDGPGTGLSTVSDVIFTFDNPIAGLIFSDDKPVWLGDNYLGDSEPTFGLAGVTYPASLNGPNFDLLNPNGDEVTVLADRTKLLINHFATTSGVDEMRVLVFTPEPDTYMLLGGVLVITLIAYHRRKRKAKM